MYILITHEKGWMGHPKGSRINMSKEKVLDLVHRGIGISDDPAPKKPVKKKIVKRFTKDKMVRTSKNK